MMKNHFKIMLLAILSFAYIQPCYAQQLKYQAEALLDSSATELKQIANNGDLDAVRFKVAASKLLLGVAIWNQHGQLVLPRQQGLTHRSEDRVLDELYRLVPLLESANPTAWEQHTADGSSLLYCRKEAISLCFLVDAQALAKRLGQDRQSVFDDILKKQSQKSYRLPLFILFIVFAVLVWLYRPQLFKKPQWFNKQKSTSPLQQTSALKIAELYINPSKLVVNYRDQVINVSDKDIKLLTLFANRPDEVISKEELYEAVWQRPFLSSSRALDQHMMVLRRKINIDINQASIIETVHGQGYRYNSAQH